MAREASLVLFSPRIMAMDAYSVMQLPQEQLVVYVAATAGQVGYNGLLRKGVLLFVEVQQPRMGASNRSKQQCNEQSAGKCSPQVSFF